MNNTIELINQRLNTIISNYKDGLVKEAMLYSIKAGGKRIRPLIFIQTLKSYEVYKEDYLDIACAIEMIHTYSLIHDDLPGMDNDDLRRGMPTCHIQFDEATAILAGDALLNEAMNTILHSHIEDSKKLEVLSCLFKASGLNGMIYGQQQDMYYENHKANLKDLEDIHHYKTGALISASFELAGIIAGKDRDILKQLGYTLGLAFQIQDDILDVTSSTELLGKPVGSDMSNHKTTYVTLMSLDKAKEYCDDLFRKCYELTYQLLVNHGLILELIESVKKRVN